MFSEFFSEHLNILSKDVQKGLALSRHMRSALFYERVGRYPQGLTPGSLSRHLQTVTAMLPCPALPCPVVNTEAATPMEPSLRIVTAEVPGRPHCQLPPKGPSCIRKTEKSKDNCDEHFIKLNI